MNDNTPQSLSFPHKDVNALGALLDLPAQEFKLMIILMCHCLRGTSCFPSISRLCSFMKLERRQVQYLLSSLEQKGFLKRAIRSGKSTVYYPIVDRPVQSVAQVKADPCNPLRTTCATECIPPVQSTAPIIKKRELREPNYENPQPSVSGSRKRDSSKKAVAKDPPDPRVNELIKHWCREWEAFDGRPYVVDWGSDGAMLKQRLKDGISVETLQAAMVRCIQDPSEFWEGKKTIRAFASPKTINQWLQRIPRQRSEVSSDDGTKHIAEAREREKLINQDRKARGFSEGNQNVSATATGSQETGHRDRPGSQL